MRFKCSLWSFKLRHCESHRAGLTFGFPLKWITSQWKLLFTITFSFFFLFLCPSFPTLWAHASLLWRCSNMCCIHVDTRGQQHKGGQPTSWDRHSALQGWPRHRKVTAFTQEIWLNIKHVQVNVPSVLNAQRGSTCDLYLRKRSDVLTDSLVISPPWGSLMLVKMH